ncbi:MAG: biotin transporter BioY [Clostridia bacterium]|nr:biotin transporter BioY [Clostridia bacterium]
MKPLRYSRITNTKTANSVKLQKRKSRTLRLVLIAIFIALIAVGAFIKFPIGIIPVSMQCAMCVLCALILGAKDGAATIAIYLIMGLIGIPIFTAGGGFTYVLQPTFGYLLGYLVAVPVGAIVARGVHNTARPKLWRLLLGSLTVLAILYTFGVFYMYLMLNFYMGKALDMSKAWLTGAAVFLPTDGMWCVVASLIAYKVVPLVYKYTLGRLSVTQTEEYVRTPETESNESNDDSYMFSDGSDVSSDDNYELNNGNNHLLDNGNNVSSDSSNISSGGIVG